jgi:hypothetical protein
VVFDDEVYYLLPDAIPVVNDGLHYVFFVLLVDYRIVFYYANQELMNNAIILRMLQQVPY